MILPERLLTLTLTRSILPRRRVHGGTGRRRQLDRLADGRRRGSARSLTLTLPLTKTGSSRPLLSRRALTKAGSPRSLLPRRALIEARRARPLLPRLTALTALAKAGNPRSVLPLPRRALAEAGSPRPLLRGTRSLPVLPLPLVLLLPLMTLFRRRGGRLGLRRGRDGWRPGAAEAVPLRGRVDRAGPAVFLRPVAEPVLAAHAASISLQAPSLNAYPTVTWSRPFQITIL
jgi:hypothetical protein